MRRNEQVSARRLDCVDEMLRLSDLTGPGTGPGDVLGIKCNNIGTSRRQGPGVQEALEVLSGPGTVLGHSSTD